jgi:hypothetical protein
VNGQRLEPFQKIDVIVIVCVIQRLLVHRIMTLSRYISSTSMISPIGSGAESSFR